MRAYMGYFLATNAESMAFMVAMATTDDQELSDLQDEIYDPKKRRQEEFENWKEAFEQFESRPPTEEEIAAEWELLNSIPDEKFKVDY